MDWRFKALVQTLVSWLPEPVGQYLYYRLQRLTPTFRNLTPRLLRASVETASRLVDSGFSLRGKVFLEVGTGRAPIIALGFWLMGAARTLTIDLNRYVRDDLTREALAYIRRNPDEVREIFRGHLDEARLSRLLEDQDYSAERLMKAASIEYLAPADASDLAMADHSVDFHTSYTVLEHVPGSAIKAILKEGGRLVRPGGAFIHLVDYSDHFSHGDPSIGPLNFLRYSQRVWRWYAGNRFMYMNRLRHDEMRQLFVEAGHRVLQEEVMQLSDMSRQLRDGELRLDAEFASMSTDILTIGSCWFITQSRQPVSADSLA